MLLYHVRYEVWDTDPYEKIANPKVHNTMRAVYITCPDILIFMCHAGCRNDQKWCSSVTSSWMSYRAIYELMIQCWWVCIVYVFLVYITITFRHPEASGRPFSTLLSRLSQPDNELLKWTDTITHDPQSTMLGAPLKTASDLQQQYIN